MSWQAGKLATYVALGALAGWAGNSVPGPPWLAQVLSSVLLVWFAGALAGFVPEPTLSVPGVARLARTTAAGNDLASRLAFGAVNGLLPCGLVYAALGLVIAAGNPLTGALAMLAFGLGTAPLVTTFALGARRLSEERPWVRRALALLVLGVGLWVVVRRGTMGSPTP
jgi:sulfite exporter TauE/SafE